MLIVHVTFSALALAPLPSLSSTTCSARRANAITSLLDSGARGGVHGLPPMLKRVRSRGMRLSSTAVTRDDALPDLWEGAHTSLTTLLRGSARVNSALQSQPLVVTRGGSSYRVVHSGTMERAMLHFRAELAAKAMQLLYTLSCSLLLLQLAAHSQRESATPGQPAAEGEQPSGLAERKHAASARAPRAGIADTAMDATGAALLWQSLGAFGGAHTPSDEALWKDFVVLDTDGDGAIGARELQLAVRRAAPAAKSVDVAQRMVDFADLNQDGILDFAEYRQLRRAAHPADYMMRYKRRWSS